MSKTQSVKIICLKCKSQTDTVKPDVKQMEYKTKTGKLVKSLVLKSNCSVRSTKKNKFAPTQEANGLLSLVGIKTPLAKISIIEPIVG